MENSISFDFMKKEWQSFLHAFRGIFLVVREERHFRFHLLAVCIVSAAGWHFNISLSEWIYLALCFGLVLMAEAFNSAAEAVCDAVTLDKNPFIKKAKDLAAGAVLIASIAAAVVGALIFFPRFF